MSHTRTVFYNAEIKFYIKEIQSFEIIFFLKKSLFNLLKEIHNLLLSLLLLLLFIIIIIIYYYYHLQEKKVETPLSYLSNCCCLLRNISEKKKNCNLPNKNESVSFPLGNLFSVVGHLPDIVGDVKPGKNERKRKK